MQQYCYPLITVLAPALTVSIISFVLRDMIWTYRQRTQAAWLLREARRYFSESEERQQAYADQVTVLHDIFACHEMSMNYHKTARKKNDSLNTAKPNRLPRTNVYLKHGVRSAYLARHQGVIDARRSGLASGLALAVRPAGSTKNAAISGASHPSSTWDTAPGAMTRSNGPSPTTW